MLKSSICTCTSINLMPYSTLCSKHKRELIVIHFTQVHLHLQFHFVFLVSSEFVLFYITLLFCQTSSTTLTEHYFVIVYTTQFVALFIGGSCLEKKQSSNAYLSQSTRGLRSLLRKHGVCFSMPLCNTEVEQATEDDLIELSEIQRRNLGQALHLDALSEVDNTTQSLLSFTGNENVHGLYDVLLNYKSLLNSLSAADVPVLYSPQPFQNGCLHIPEVKCREMRRADMGSGGFDTEQGPAFASMTGNICYSMEIKDAVLPPWVVSGLCGAMSLDATSFDLTIATEPSSMGLNVALNSMGTTNAQPEGATPSSALTTPFVGGIPDAALVPSLHSASVRRLSYNTKGGYVAHTTV